MIKKQLIKKIIVTGILLLLLGTNIALGTHTNPLEENTGEKRTTPSHTLLNNAQDNILLIPDWSYDRVLAFDPSDGSYIEEIIPTDGHLASPKCAIPSGRDTIFVSDQVTDGVYEFDTEGNYITTITNLASSGIDNIRGITIYEDHLYVTVYQGTYAQTIQRFDLNGGSQSTWTSTQISSPFDIHFRNNDALVANAASDTIEQYNHDGTWTGTFVGTGIQWPSQIYERSNGNLYVTGSFSPAGIYEYDQNGIQLNYYPISQTMRGVHELENGLILFTTVDSVSTYNPSNGAIVDVYTDGNFQFIHSLTTDANHPPYEPSNPHPQHGAYNIEIDTNLEWNGGDPDGDPVTYDIYFGTTSPPPKIVSNHSSTTYTPGTLTFNTQYHWQIIAWDNHDTSTQGTTWEFTTMETPGPVLEIESITGGLGVTAVIQNSGNDDATNVNTAFTISGGLILLPPGGIKTVEMGTIESKTNKAANTILLGIGKPTITVEVTCDEGAIANATYQPTFVFLFLVL